ncbi:MAG: reverse transcriptase/maturase family protein [Campylobacterota bacterium]|nr:reverse transcriptase/maturase family protein [Campylobacterota bacterium]
MKFTKYLKRKTLKDTFDNKLQYSYTLGSDGISTNKFSEIIDEEITIIKRKVKNQTYNISPYKEQLIVKNRTSNPRMISIPTNRDKLALSALQKFLAEEFKGKVSNDNVNEKIHKIKQEIQSQKYDSFIKLDIKSFYPNIDHKILLDKVKKQVTDEEAIYLLEKALTQVTIEKGRRADKKNNIGTKGVPQGLSISNILSSIYLMDLDTKYSKKTNLEYYRFVDDILILCDCNDIETIKSSICIDTKELLLDVHEFKDNSDKSTSGTIYKDKFQFLGFEFYENIITVREQSADMLRDRIVSVFYSNAGKSDYDLYKELNLKISGCIYNNKQYGWMQFFRQIDDQTLLYSLDSFVKNQFNRFNRKYKESTIKKFTKTYFLLKDYDADKLNKNTYIPKFGTDINKEMRILIQKTMDDVEFY